MGKEKHRETREIFDIYIYFEIITAYCRLWDLGSFQKYSEIKNIFPIFEINDSVDSVIQNSIDILVTIE